MGTWEGHAIPSKSPIFFVCFCFVLFLKRADNNIIISRCHLLVSGTMVGLCHVRQVHSLDTQPELEIPNELDTTVLFLSNQKAAASSHRELLQAHVPLHSRVHGDHHGMAQDRRRGPLDSRARELAPRVHAERLHRPGSSRGGRLLRCAYAQECRVLFRLDRLLDSSAHHDCSPRWRSRP